MTKAAKKAAKKGRQEAKKTKKAAKMAAKRPRKLRSWPRKPRSQEAKKMWIPQGWLLLVWTVGFTGCVSSYTMQAVDRDTIRDVGFDTWTVGFTGCVTERVIQCKR